MRLVARVLIIFLSLTDVWFCTLPFIWMIVNMGWFEEHNYVLLYALCAVFATYSLIVGMSAYIKACEHDGPSGSQ